MKKVRGLKSPQPTVREPESSIQDEDQYSGTEVSSREAARIRDEVQGVMKQQFVQARAQAEAISKLEQKIAAQESRSKSVNTTAREDEVIDLISKSAAALQKSPPSVLPGSPISVASTPSHAGNGGSAPGFSQLSSGSHPLPPRRRSPPCIGSQKSLHAFSDAVPRMSTHGHLWCVITLPLWEVVTPSKSRIRLRSCANQRMSGISDMKEGIGIRPVIGLSCVICCWKGSDLISVPKRRRAS